MDEAGASAHAFARGTFLRDGEQLKRSFPDLVGVIWVLGAAFAVLLPALVHGSSFGSYDVLSVYGLFKQPNPMYHTPLSLDPITEMIPWTTVAWQQVHHGHLPLWNPYSVLGLPLAFNWLSAAFSVPSLIGYIVPLHLAYTVQIIVTLIIAGTGMYVLGRVLHLGVLGSAMAATVFELSGPSLNTLGWPLEQVMSWAGWLFALAVLLIRGRHRARDVVLFALVVTAMIYAGFPELVIFVGLVLALFVGAYLLLHHRWNPSPTAILRPVGDLIVAGVAGLALGAPLILPGLQLASQSIRSQRIGVLVLPLHTVIGVVFEGFDGRPESAWPGVGFYVGAIALVLAFVGVVARRKRPEVMAFGVVALATSFVLWIVPSLGVLQALPFHLSRAKWVYMLGPLAMVLAILTGVGTDAVVRAPASRAMRRGLAAGFATMGVVLAAVWLFGRGTLPAFEATIRDDSFTWPAVETAIGLAVAASLALYCRRWGRAAGSPAARSGVVAGVALLVAETVFLVAMGAPLMSSSPNFFTPTAAVTALQRAVGSSEVACGVERCWGPTGIIPNVNVAFQVHEFAAYDPITPSKYFTRWHHLSGQAPQFPGSSVFTPLVTTVSEAREFGIRYILEPPGSAGPPGAVFVGRIGPENLYSVPGAAAAILVSSRGDHGLWPAISAPGTPVPVTHTDPASWTMTAHDTESAVLRLHLTDVPGWHASVDGQPLTLHPFAGTMLQARLPSGTHTIHVWYWPPAFSIGLVLALCGALALAGVIAVAVWQPRRGRRGRGEEHEPQVRPL